VHEISELRRPTSGQTKMTVVSGTGGVQDADRVTLCGRRAVEATVSVVTITSKSLQTVYVKPADSATTRRCRHSDLSRSRSVSIWLQTSLEPIKESNPVAE